MSKKIRNEKVDFDGVSILIRNMEASLIYYLCTEQNNEHKKIVIQYQALCSKKNKMKGQIKKEKDSDKKIEIANLKEGQIMIESNIKKLGKQIFKMDKSYECKLNGKNNRYYYKGNLNDSLMRRELLNQIEMKDKNCDKFSVNDIKNPTVGFSDIIINIAFKTDFMVKDDESENGTFHRKIINPKKLREIFYRDGIWVDGNHFVEFQRSSSKARTGDCLFIKEQYLEEMQSWQRLGLNFRKETMKKDGSSYKNPQYIEVDITGARSYESLTSSSIIGEVNIDPYNILLIDDVAGTYNMNCNVVTSETETTTSINIDGEETYRTENVLAVKEEDYTLVTDLWDGQSLVDESVFDCKYKNRDKNGNIKYLSLNNKGFLLLRNHFIKSAGFNTKLHQWYMSDEVQNALPMNDDGIRCGKDRFGNLISADKIQMVTTKNSVKIFREPFMGCILYEEIVEKGTITHADGTLFTKLEIQNLEEIEKESLVWDWYRMKLKSCMGNRMGVCKFEKSSKFADGLYQQLAYQMLNSLGFTKDDIEKLTMPQIQEIMRCKNNVAFFKNLIGVRENHSAKQSMMLALLSVNDRVENTQIYKDYRDEQIRRLKERILGGKILTENSDYCVLFGNPYEMLLASAGMLEVENGIAKHSIMGTQEQIEKNQFECYTSKYLDDEELFGFRSPHICEANAVYLVNKVHDEYKWFNALTLSKNIVAINFHGYGAFINPKWSGCDVDSDSILMGNDQTVLQRVVEAQRALLPINGIKPKPRNKPFTEHWLADADDRLSNDYIGRICNLAQNLQSYYWHIYNTKGTDGKYLKEIYNDISILNVLSGIAIDNAKRESPVDIGSEIDRMNKRPYLFEKGAIIKNDTVAFIMGEGKDKKTYFKKPKFMMRNRKFIKKKYSKEIADIIKTIKQESRKSPEEIEKTILKVENGERLLRYKQKIDEYNQKQKELVEKMYLPFDTPMDMINVILQKNIKKAVPTSLISITEILNDIPSGEKADYNRVNRIIEEAIKYGKELDMIQSRCNNNEINKEQVYEQKKRLSRKQLGNLVRIKLVLTM